MVTPLSGAAQAAGTEGWRLGGCDWHSCLAALEAESKVKAPAGSSPYPVRALFQVPRPSLLAVLTWQEGQGSSGCQAHSQGPHLVTRHLLRPHLRAPSLWESG